jgi:hypothetical protein
MRLDNELVHSPFCNSGLIRFGPQRFHRAAYETQTQTCPNLPRPSVVNDLATDHGDEGLDVLDLVRGDREVVAIQHQ